MDYQKLQERAEVLLTAGVTTLTEEYRRQNDDDDEEQVFSGEVYKNHSRLRGGKLRSNIIGNPTRLIKFKAKFIIGYNLTHSDLFYEIWFLPYTSEYLLVDRFGKRTHSNRSDTLDTAVDHLLDIISKEDRLELGDDFERGARQRSKMYDSVEIDQAYIDNLMETSTIARKIFVDDINANVKEYSETRMNHNMISKLWSIPLGRSITYPSKYLGGRINKLFKIFGKDREATFVTGYTFNNQIDTEIWLVKSLVSGKGSFYVFDITSAKLIDSKLPNLRQAITAIANKISVSS